MVNGYADIYLYIYMVLHGYTWLYMVIHGYLPTFAMDSCLLDQYHDFIITASSWSNLTGWQPR